MLVAFSSISEKLTVEKLTVEKLTVEKLTVEKLTLEKHTFEKLTLELSKVIFKFYSLEDQNGRGRNAPAGGVSSLRPQFKTLSRFLFVDIDITNFSLPYARQVEPIR